MEIKYQSSLEHQQKAVDAIVKVFDKVLIDKPSRLYENPGIRFYDPKIVDNIKAIQTDPQYNVDAEYRFPTDPIDYLNLDIKMETGTGKTYVYTHAIYELHQRYGINKFIVAVPSLAIKEGAKSFLGDSDVRRHFCNTRGYNAEIDLFVLKAMTKKKGKSFFPTEVSNFVRGSHQISNRIYVLLLNMALLSEKANGMLNREYDYAPEGFHLPYDALRATRPFLIIDEPHRFSRDQKAYEIITKKIKPQCIIRFGATFPEKSTGKGKNRIVGKDYRNLLYNLNSCMAFNQNLIKGVSKEHFESPSKKNEKIKITSIENKTKVVFHHEAIVEKRTATGVKNNIEIKPYNLQKDDSLAMISSDMTGLTILNIGNDFVEFSNGQTKRVGEEFDVTIFAQSYQEAMIKLAIERHFETERKNFNRSHRIKTLALFFIDDILSFRGDENGNGAWLRDTFEQLLKERLENELKKPNSPEYEEFLHASLQNIRDCSAGYFAQDNSDSDEEIAKEVDDILRNKKEMLSFKDNSGNWIVRRFLFSKWTLKEGWDNPNVFTIAKLRSSGSENSKIQEVGRGLRLPVDEHGNRVSNEEFQLNYIVDFKEADFANRLVAEINGDMSSSNEIIVATNILDEVARKRGTSTNQLFVDLLSKSYIDIDKKVNISTLNDFYTEYPEFRPTISVQNGKIIDRNKKDSNTVGVRSQQYSELEDLWKKINQKYVIFFENELNQKIINEFHLEDTVFSSMVIESQRDKLSVSEDEANVVCEAGVQYGFHGKQIPYHEFLTRISKFTSLPIDLIHRKIVEYSARNTFKEDYINESSVTNFINLFNDWKVKNVLGLLKYKKANYNPKETALTDVNGDLKNEIIQGLIGVTLENGSPSTKYLYDKVAYDSDLEKKNILADVEDVIVFGKIPRRSIAIPTVIDNYSPDFMYVVRKKDGSKELNIVIETKGVEGKISLRHTEQIRIDCARKFFEQLQVDSASSGFEVKFRTQINNEQMQKIVASLVE